MRFLSLLLCCLAGALSACTSTRTVLSGPQKVSAGNGASYSAESEARSTAAGQAAAASGVVGQFGQGDASFQERFASFDPGGYIRQDPKDPRKTIWGLNSMSEKNFGGDLNTKDMKSFGQTRDFLTRKYDTRELNQKNSSAQGVKSWFSNKKANADRMASESNSEFSGSGRVLSNKMSSSEGRSVATKDARESGRTVDTKNYYPAQKVLDRGGDAPKIIGQGDKQTNESVWRLIKSRTRDNPASVEDIRSLLGKSQ